MVLPAEEIYLENVFAKNLNGIVAVHSVKQLMVLV